MSLGKAWRILATVVLALAPAACGNLIDSEEARLCRLTLPALHPDATAIELLKTDRADKPYDVAVRYRVTERGRSTTESVRCGFGEDNLTRSRVTLEHFATQAGPWSPLKIHILNRYWLERPDYSALADPGAGDVPPLLGVMPEPAAYFVQALVNALPSTALMMMIGAAYALTYGLVGRINLAFGELAMAGAYGTVIAAGAIAFPTGAGLAVAGVAGLLFTALWGYATERVVFSPLVGKSGQSVLVATLGLALTMQEFFRLSQGNEQRWIAPVLSDRIVLAEGGGFVASTTTMQIAVSIIPACAALLLAGIMRWSEFGRHWRAVADDPLMARLTGISPQAVLAEAFLLASLLAGIGGFVLAAHFGGAGFAAGTVIGLKGLIAAVVGGMGSVGGALMGGIAIGLFEACWSAYLPNEHKDIAVFLLLVGVFIVKPGGLFGLADNRPRQV